MMAVEERRKRTSIKKVVIAGLLSLFLEMG